MSGIGDEFDRLELPERTNSGLIFDNQKLVLTVREVASILRVSTKTIYKKVRHSEIPHKKIGSKIRFLRPEVVGWLKGN